MAEKELTKDEIYRIGLKIVENREKQREEGRKRRKAKKVLYDLWKANDRTPIGDIKV